MSDYLLKVKMLGEFSISNDYYRFAPVKSKSLQVIRLITYLLSNKDIEIARDKLIDILWPEEEIDNPSGALRNLIYRSRQELNHFFTGQEPVPDCILLSQNGYMWNPEIECEVDIYRFEHYISLADKEPELQEQYNYYKNACELYTGEFLPLQASEEWVVFRSVYYKNLYTKAIVKMCQYLNTQERYTDVIELCDSSSLLNQLEEQIHREKLKAYLNSDSVQQALDYYYAISDLFSQELGVDLSQSMGDIYKEIIKRLPDHHISINSLEESLKDAHIASGTFYCNFDVFRSIYQVNLRSVRRSSSKRYLALFTLKDMNVLGKLTTDLKSEMKLLYQILTSQLRSNDIYTQSSPSQFSLIISVANEKGRNIVLQRITDKYAAKRRHTHIALNIESKLIQ